MTTQEKFLYHQIHPLKIITDLLFGALSLWLLWYNYNLLFWILGIIPTLLISTYLIRFVDLSSLKNSKAGDHYRRFQSGPKIQLLRVGGQIILWTSAEKRVIYGIIGGCFLISTSWLIGFWKSKTT